ncbi:MAG: hypothetical protein JXA30_15605 [Deltaproteobacteria bacterium]|nr:hypothetical protein [Deltaproteobacteria bacterium]
MITAVRAKLIPYPLALCAIIGAIGPVSAQESFEGTWRAGPTAVDVSIKSWGADCGRRPESANKSGGGEVSIEQKGDHLYIHGGDRTINTNACWSPNRSMSRVASSVLDNLWTVRCSTAPDDPKAEKGEYTIRATTKNSLYYKEVSSYDWELNESNCVATITVTQTLTRVEQAGKSRTATAKVIADKVDEAPEEKPESQSAEPCLPTIAAKLVLQPKKIEIAPGQRVCLKARVEDSSGCPLPEQPVEWSLHHSRALRGQLINGCFVASKNAAEAEGEFRIVAISGELRAQALIAVTPIDLSDIIARRIETAAFSGFEKKGEAAAMEPEAAVKITQREVKVQPYRILHTGIIVVGGALIAVLLGLLVWLRRRAGNLTRLSITASDESKDVAGITGSHSESISDEKPRVDDQMLICPECRRGYSSQYQTCPKDSTKLIPYDQFVQEHKAQHLDDKRKKCPTCGAIYESSVTFCANDGSTLVQEDS